MPTCELSIVSESRDPSDWRTRSQKAAMQSGREPHPPGLGGFGRRVRCSFMVETTHTHTKIQGDQYE